MRLNAFDNAGVARLFGRLATAVFALVNGRGRRCDASVQRAAVVFRVRGGEIRSWTRVPVPPPKRPAA